MVQEAQRFGSVAGGVSRSGLRIGEEDPPFNPRTLASQKQRLQFQSPYPPAGQRQYVPPRILPGLEGAAPMPDFSGEAGGDARGAMPPMPQERIQRPVYQEPEAPGWKRTALGIGLSGMANLTGGGPRAADQFFLEPERRAEREYARDLGAYSASQGEWSDYWNQIMQGQEIDIRERTLEEGTRQFEEEGRRPIPVPRGGSLYSPTAEEAIYTDPRGAYGSQWESQREDAINYWLQFHPETMREQMTAADEDEAITGWRRRQGREVAVPGFGPEGELRNIPRSESYYQERPANRFDEYGNIIYQGQQGTTGTRPRVSPINEEDLARVDEWEADEKRRARRDHQSAGLQLLAPLPGTPEREAFDKSLDDELLAIEAEAEIRRERLRSGTIERLPGEGRVLQYNIRTGRAE